MESSANRRLTLVHRTVIAISLCFFFFFTSPSSTSGTDSASDSHPRRSPVRLLHSSSTSGVDSASDSHSRRSPVRLLHSSSTSGSDSHPRRSPVRPLHSSSTSGSDSHPRRSPVRLLHSSSTSGSDSNPRRSPVRLLHSSSTSGSDSASDSHPRRSPARLVHSVCNSTRNPKFCRSALTADNRTAAVHSLSSLAVITLDLAEANATSALLRLNHTMRRLKRFKSLPDRARRERAARRMRIVEACKVAYRDVALSFRSAYQEAEDGDFMTANYDSLIAGDDAAGCGEKLVSGRVGNASLLWKMQNDLLCFSNMGYMVTYSL